MKRLTEKELIAAIVEMKNTGLANWQAWYDENDTKPARLEFPSGEIANPGIGGFIWAWRKRGILSPQRIEKRDRFNAQGLEGKIVIRLSFSAALLAAKELPAH